MSIRPQDNRDGDVYMISFPRFASDSLWRCEYEYGRGLPKLYQYMQHGVCSDTSSGI